MEAHLTEILIVGASIYGIVTALRKGFPQFFERDLVTRLLPVIVLALGALVFYLWPLEMSAVRRILLGIIAGSFSSQIHNILKQMLKRKA